MFLDPSVLQSLNMYAPNQSVPETMRAMVYDAGGPGHMMWQSMAKVPRPGKHEVLVRVISSSINPLDYRIADSHSLFLANRGKFVGQDVAGIVVAVGKNVTSVHNGDKVFGWGSGYAQYATCAVNQIYRIPSQMVSSHPETSLLDSTPLEKFGVIPCAAVTANQVLRKHWLDRPNVQVKSLLIIGGSGGVGSSLIQIARSIGGPEMRIYAICSNKNMDYCKELGATETIDYTVRDFDLSKTIPIHSLDLIVDTVSGSPEGTDYFHTGGMFLLKQSGKYVVLNSKSTMDHFRATLTRFLGLNFQRARFDLHLTRKSHSDKDLEAIAQLINQGKFKLHVSEEVALTETNIRRAMHTMKQRHVRGKIMIKPEHLNSPLP